MGQSEQDKDSSEVSGNSITDGDGKAYQSLEERGVEIPELSTGKISKILAIYALKSWPVLFTALFCLCGYAISKKIIVPFTMSSLQLESSFLFTLVELFTLLLNREKWAILPPLL